MKALAIVLAVLLAVSGVHVRLWLAGCPVPVPVPVLILGVVLAVIAALCWLIRRAVRAYPLSPPLPWRTA